MSSIYSEIRKEVKTGNKKLVNVTYTPDIYKTSKVLQEDHPGFKENDRHQKIRQYSSLYWIKNK